MMGVVRPMGLAVLLPLLLVPRWRRELPPFSSAYGTASSPIVVDGIVVLACDQQVGSYLFGRGRRDWPRPMAGYLNEAEWTRIRDAGVGRFGLMAIRLNEAVDDSSVLWRLERNVPYVPAPLLYDGLIYMVKSGGIASVMDPATGTLLKQARLRDALGDYFASPVAGDGKVYSASAEGKITVLAAGRDLRVLAVNDLEDAIETVSTVMGKPGAALSTDGRSGAAVFSADAMKVRSRRVVC